MYTNPSTLLLFSHKVVSDSLRPRGLYHARLLSLPLSPRICSNSCPLSQWCHLTISSSGALFSFSLSTDSLSFVLLTSNMSSHHHKRCNICVMKILETEVFQFSSWILFFRSSLCFSFGSFYWHIWFFPWPGPVCSWDHQGHEFCLPSFDFQSFLRSAYTAHQSLHVPNFSL